MKLIDKSALVAEIKRQLSAIDDCPKLTNTQIAVLEGDKVVLTKLLSFIDTLEVKDPYEQTVQYDSIKAGIQAYAETYSFNIESLLFNQLTKEQQALWRKEIEQAVVSGGEVGYELAKDSRYKENVEVKGMDLEEEIDNIWNPRFNLGWDEKSLLSMNHEGFTTVAKHFFELGLKAQKGE